METGGNPCVPSRAPVLMAAADACAAGSAMDPGDISDSCKNVVVAIA